jgi:hypothetical protein
MNDPVTSTTGSNLEQQVAALQRQVFLLLVALNVVTATIVFYFCYESHIASVAYYQGRGHAMDVIQQYQKNALAIQKFDQQLAAFGTTHPGFQPVLRKYGWTPPGSSSPTAQSP